VLLVDDEVTDRTAVASTLQDRGFQVLQSESYSDAMAVFDLHSQSIQLLIAAVALPDGNGCALAAALRKQKLDLRALFVSHRAGAEACKYYGLDVSDNHFLAKPFSSRRLMRRVRLVLEDGDSFPALNTPKALTSSG
jgi:DNA-binding response OmpR family regulator